MSASIGTSTCRLLVLLACFALLSGATPGCAHAQSLISAAPLMPFQNLPDPGKDPSAAGDVRPDRDIAREEEDKAFHIPLILNESVENQIAFFTTSGRSIFQAWLKRSARYLPLMKKIFREFNLPEDLVYVAMIESGFNPNAVSEKKAVGPWQFMRATAEEYGLYADGWVDERRDPIKSTRAAAAHFRDLYNLFGSWPMVLASYNAGMGRMQGAMLKAQTDDFWELRAARLIHLETQEYVPRYMAALIIAKDPAAYGFRQPEEEPFIFDEIVVHQSTDLYRIASYTGASYREIRELNPELLQAATPRSRYVLRVPPGTSQLYEVNRGKVAVAGVRQDQASGKKKRNGGQGGWILPGLASAFRAAVPERLSPVRIISRFSSHLDLNVVLGLGASAPTDILR